MVTDQTPPMDLLRDAVQWCPEHHMRDCSPLLNGCSKVMHQIRTLNELEDYLMTTVIEAYKVKQWDALADSGVGKYINTELRSMRELGRRFLDLLDEDRGFDNPSAASLELLAQEWRKVMDRQLDAR